MRKYFVTFRIKKDLFNYSILEIQNQKKRTIQNIVEFSPKNSQALNEFLQQIKLQIKTLPTASSIITNVIFDDDQFNVDISNISISNQNGGNELLNENHLELEKRLSEYCLKKQINPVSLNKYAFINEYDKETKVYRKFPLGKKSKKITVKCSAFAISSNDKFNTLKTFFEKNFPNVNFYFKSQIIANYYKDIAGFNFLVDINRAYSVIALVYNGVVLKQKVLSVGTEKIYQMIAQETNLTIEEIEQRFNYLKNINYKEQNLDDGVVPVIKIIDQFSQWVFYETNQFYSEAKTGNNQINVLAIGGSLAKIIEKNVSFLEFDYKQVHIKEVKNTKNIFKINDFATTWAIEMFDEAEEDSLSSNNTIDRIVQIENKTNLMTKIKNVFVNK